MTSSPPPDDDRRRYQRIKYSLEVDWGPTPACEFKGQVTILSVGGCFLQTPIAAARDELIFIRIMLAPKSERVMEGVIWGRVAHHMPGIGLGVEFKQLPPGYAQHIDDIVEFHVDSDENT